MLVDISYHHIRFACSIELQDFVILTGGYDMSYHGPMDQATIYNQLGFQADLPSLNTGRYSHACGHFVNMDMQAVSQYHASVYPCHVAVSRCTSWLEGTPPTTSWPPPRCWWQEPAPGWRLLLSPSLWRDCGLSQSTT